MQSIVTKGTGDSLTAAEWNGVPDELENSITDTGQTLSGGDLFQVSKAMATYASGGAFYTDSGAADAYVLTTVGSKRAPIAYFDGMGIEFVAGNQNTGASTVNVSGLGVKSVVIPGGTAPPANSISGKVAAFFDNSNDRFELVGVLSSQDIISKIQPFDASVAANALTGTLDPTDLDFRSATLSSGAVNSRSVTSQLSLVVPSTATLGTIAAVKSNIMWLAIDNAGTLELAVVNLSGGVDLSETGVITTVSIDATADLANVIYSDTARASVPYRVVGFVESTQATPGTWATTPSLVQGAGGSVLSPVYGKTNVDVSGSRSYSVTYYNETRDEMFVSVRVTGSASGQTLRGNVDSITVINEHSDSVSFEMSIGFFVPPGKGYTVTSSATPSVNVWRELRAQ